MAEDASTDRGKVGRKKALAGVLLLIMVALMGRMVHFFWQEGDRMCQALQGGIERIPSAQMPCTSSSYVVGPVDWVSAATTGGSIEASKVRYQYDDDGDLYQVESDRGGDGAVDITYRCSTLGKILMPMTNYAAWSSYSTFEELSRGSPREVERTSDDEEDEGVSGLRTRLKILGAPAFSMTQTVRASTLDEDDRLTRRVVQGIGDGQATISDYEYDADGNLLARRQLYVNHPYSLSRQTDYTYRCWE